ncbi:dihydroneopterin aldolase [Synechococcus sp. M16CYN]|uniref:dihydroneopterin aldolase n=1 Tax=Synechococcus sp. M16CYN TaxID=3103139 RepID=UPI00333EB212
MDSIHINDLRLWAHVGILERERRDGQWFRLDLRFELDLGPAVVSDNLDNSLDYSLVIRTLQSLARKINCLTVEHFSEQVLNRIERLYGPIPVGLRLTKCAAPVPGFSGLVAVERQRHGGYLPTL